MEVDWSTLEAIAKTGAIDVWYLFSMSGFYRQATRDHGSLDEDKRAALTRMLGTDAWESELYKARPENDLFGGDPSMSRHADVATLEAYAKAKPFLAPHLIHYRCPCMNDPSGSLSSSAFRVASRLPSDWLGRLAITFLLQASHHKSDR